MKNKGIDWIIHFVVNGAECDVCRKVEDYFPEFLCNAHTHGLERYGHLDFQIVLAMDHQITGTILNELGLRVQAGEKFNSGDVLSDALKGPYDVRLVEMDEGDRKVLRVVLPDENNLFPGDDGCKYPYDQQLKFKTVF